MIIGIDLHKATHTAVALSSDEQELASKKVRSGGHQAEHLLAWAEPFEARMWAIESAGGLGYGTDISAGYIQHPRPQFAAQSRRLVYVTAASDLGPTDSNSSPDVYVAVPQTSTPG